MATDSSEPAARFVQALDRADSAARLRHALGILLLAGVYFGSAKLGLRAAVAQPVVSSAWPPSGIALAALLLFGVRFWPGVTLGAFFLNASAGVPLAGAAGIAAGNTLEAVVGAILLVRAAHVRPSLSRSRDVFALIGLGAGVATAVSATIGVASLWLAGSITEASRASLWIVWWSGDAIGILVVTPLLLTWAVSSRMRLPVRRRLEVAAIFVTLVLLTHVLFHGSFNSVYAIFPVVSWAALRFGPRGAASATALVSALAISYTVRGFGPFAGGGTRTEELFLIQTYIALLAVTGLLLAAAAAERESAEAALESSEERFRDAAARAPLGIYRSTRGGRLVFANPAFVELLGYSSPEDVLALDLGRDVYFDAAEREHLIAEMERCGGNGDFELRLKHRDGHRLWVRLLCKAVPDEQGQVAYFDGFVHDIAERREAEEALRASEERYRLLFENNPQPMWAFDEETLAFLAVNAAACHHYGYSREEFLAMTIQDIRPPAEVPQLLQTLSEEPRSYQKTGTWKHRKKDGSLIEVEIASHPFLFDGRKAQLVLAHDVTEQRRLELQLRQAQKMEAVGRLAGGVAHDFNNVLTAILGYADLLSGEVEGNPSAAECVGEIRTAGERAASLTRQLLAFSRQQMLEPKVLDLNAILSNLEKMLRRLIGEDVELVTVLDRRLGRVRADAGQVEQLVMNLAINARDAMPRGGTLTIETADVDLDATYADEHLGAQSGSYVMLALTDTGTGMSAETKSHIFEPFFTTKEQGKGTGLGLATVYGIVKQSGGYIWVYSEVGVGTTFKVYLPRVQAPLDDTVSRRAATRPHGGTETVLLVEDETAVRLLARKILENHGYKVLEADGGGAAMELVKANSGRIDLLLTDVVMPEVAGSELAAQVTEVSPETKVIYMSGYTDDAVVRHGLVDEAGQFLQKPFAPDALARKVREVLDAEPSPDRAPV